MCLFFVLFLVPYKCEMNDKCCVFRITVTALYRKTTVDSLGQVLWIT